MEPFDPSEVMAQLPSVLDLYLRIDFTSHTQLGTHYPLHLAFPRLQSLQLEYVNNGCSTCGYVNYVRHAVEDAEEEAEEDAEEDAEEEAEEDAEEDALEGA